MAKMVECVPNFSEGCNKEVIEALGQAISRTPGCVLLDVDAGASTNRTVYTFVGTPEAVVEGALSAARVAGQLIDMSQHTGEHPRMGALDVCPFVPVMNVSMEECVACAHVFGQRLSEELGVPVYLYGEAAREESRRTLPAIRAGEYEALPQKLTKPEWAPDFGPPTFVPRWGATVTGARTFLIAYNINLLCTKELAHRIALNIREQGRGPSQPGRLKKVQGIGWYLEEENIAQVSTNLLDFETTPLHAVYEEVCRDAEALNLPVVGSQLVGLVPKKAMLDTAEFYIKKEKLFILEEEHKIKLVVSRLGLDSLSPFNPRERIIEYLVQAGEEDKGLVAKPLGAFVRAVGGRSAAPGGGSVAAAAAALGAALGCMVGLMSYGKRQFEELDPIMRKLIPPFHQAMDELVAMVDADSQAFSSYMEAMKLPKNTPEERERRGAAMQQGLKTAVKVPCTLAEKVNMLWPPLKELAHHCNLACKSDIQVGAKMLEAAVFGAYFNVMINLKDITDEKFKLAMSQKVSGLLEEAKQGLALVLALLEKRLSGLWYLQRVRSARRLGASEGCGTPTKDHHLHRCKSARLPLRHTRTQGPAIQLGPALATRQCHPAPLGPVNQDTQVPVNQDTQVPVAPHHLATTHQATTTTGIPPQGCRGAHQSTLAAIRNTIRSTRRSTPSPTSTTVASTQAARAARAVLILTEDNMFHLHGGEALEETAYEDKCPTGTTCLLFCPFLPSPQSAFCLSSDFFAFSL